MKTAFLTLQRLKARRVARVNARNHMMRANVPQNNAMQRTRLAQA